MKYFPESRQNITIYLFFSQNHSTWDNSKWADPFYIVTSFTLYGCMVIKPMVKFLEYESVA